MTYKNQQQKPLENVQSNTNIKYNNIKKMEMHWSYTGKKHKCNLACIGLEKDKERKTKNTWKRELTSEERIGKNGDK